MVKFRLSLRKEIKDKKQREIWIITQASFKRKGKTHRKPVDLLTPRKDEPQPKKDWRKNLITNILNLYRKLGFTEIDTFEIEKCLKSSRFPKRDIKRAQDGFGVRAKALCGCQIYVDLNGNFYREHNCSEHPDGIPNEIFLKKYPRTEITDLYCWDCGTKLRKKVGLIEVKGFRAKVNETLFCCGCPTRRKVKVRVFWESRLKE